MRNLCNICLYRGRSMEGTFRFGDRLHVTSVSLSLLRPGDVVVYRRVNRNGVEDARVHRVIRVLPDRLIVRGDNNLCADRTWVDENNLMGRVSQFERDGKKLPMHRRRFGLLRLYTFHKRHRVRQVMWRLVRALVSKPYRSFRESGRIRHLWRPSIVTVRLMTENGPLLKYICRDRTVAWYWPGYERFTCRKPYDLVIPNRRDKK